MLSRKSKSLKTLNVAETFNPFLFEQRDFLKPELPLKQANLMNHILPRTHGPSCGRVFADMAGEAGVSSDDTPRWPPDQGLALQHERFIAEILRTRKGQDSNAKPRWLLFLESVGGVALITILLGSVGAAILNSLVQQKMKERELAGAAYQEQTKQQQQTIVQVSELIAKCISTSEDLVELWAKAFDPSRFSGQQREKIMAYRNDIHTKYNAVDSEWHAQTLKVGLSIGLLGKPEDNLAASWEKVRDSVNDYKQCAEDWNYEHEQSQEFVTDGVSRTVCNEKTKQITVELGDLAKRAERAWRAASPVQEATR